jgi:hypothetical protein
VLTQGAPHAELERRYRRPDSGMIGLRQADAPRLAVRDRFVLPDVLVARPSARGRMAFPGAGAESPGLSNASQGDTGVVGAWYQQAHASR